MPKLTQEELNRLDDEDWDKIIRIYEDSTGRCYYCHRPFIDCICAGDEELIHLDHSVGNGGERRTR